MKMYKSFYILNKEGKVVGQQPPEVIWEIQAFRYDPETPLSVTDSAQVHDLYAKISEVDEQDLKALALLIAKTVYLYKRILKSHLPKNKLLAIVRAVGIRGKAIKRAFHFALDKKFIGIAHFGYILNGKDVHENDVYVERLDLIGRWKKVKK